MDSGPKKNEENNCVRQHFIAVLLRFCTTDVKAVELLIVQTGRVEQSPIQKDGKQTCTTGR